MADQSPGDTPQLRTRLWVRVVLFVSLAFNLLIVGAVLGAVVFGGPRHGGSASGGASPELLLRALAPEDRRAIWRAARGASREAGIDRRAGGQAMSDALAALRATPFDPAQLEAAMQSQRDWVQSRQAIVQQAFLDRLSQMAPAERAAFADRLEEAMKARARKSGDGKRIKPPDG